MRFCLSAGNEPWAFVLVNPHQHHNLTVQPSQAHQPLLTVLFAGVFPREHWGVKHGIALGKVNSVLSLVDAPFARVMDHDAYCICVY